MSISKQKKVAKQLLQSAQKVYHFRRDLTSECHLAELDEVVSEVDGLIRDKATKEGPLVEAIDRLDTLLRKIGGKIYPKTFWNDNFEVALVAAIIVIGVRTFFFQPFIIPTNSMFPTYSGMKTVVYEDKNDAPSVITRTFRFLTLGARHKSLIAKCDGRVQLPMERTTDGSRLYVRQVKGKKWFVFPTVLAEYTLLVGGIPHTIRVPTDFDMQSALFECFPKADPRLIRVAGGTGYVLDFGHQVSAGDVVLRFDITLGDALFVDRISYHFKRPKPGDPFVFRTGEIPGIEGGPKNIVDKYYIKRIGGVSGEKLEIKNGALLADGEPRSEVEAFKRNERKEGEYNGYVYPIQSDPSNPPQLLTAQGVTTDIPTGSYVALGDNSANSLDSRYWGFVPEKSVIGRAIFIYYPFTKRWGLAE
ncbi:MAG: signal peptidase I [Verrucomicrobiota bacterium]|nr:signal peptidase I [Verrucomicrobiota bacterium]